MEAFSLPFSIFQHSGNNRIFRKKCSQLLNGILLGRDHLHPTYQPQGVLAIFSQPGAGGSRDPPQIGGEIFGPGEAKDDLEEVVVQLGWLVGRG